jgi:hypothetical protein
MKLYPTTTTIKSCGFLKRAKGHFGDYTTGSGTYCSDCGSRVFNPGYRGARDVKSDMEVMDELRKNGTKIPKEIQEEILEFQDKVNWRPRWKF